jgi:hypothetical protein
MANTVWFVSSRDWPGYDVTIDASPETVTAANGGLYLVHPTAAYDLLVQFVAAMTSAGVVAPAAYVTEAGYVRLTSSGVFTVTWDDTFLRDLLGFTGNLAAASAYTAPNKSTLLWSPGKTENPQLAPLGTAGQSVLDMSIAFGAEGRVSVWQHGSPTVRQRYLFRHVPKSRYQASTTPAAGDFTHFWRYELLGGQRWILLRGVTEGSSTTASASYGSATKVGPYKVDLTDRGYASTPFTRGTGFELVEAYYDVTIPGVVTSEFA